MRKTMLVIAGGLLFASPAFSQNAPQAAAMVEKGSGALSAAEALQLQGKVKSINKKARSVVVLGAHGDEVLFSLGEEVRNFDQIKVGDLVTLTYAQALAIELRKVDNKGIRERVDSEKMARTNEGGKPGGLIEKSVRVVANVVAVNPRAQTVTLRGVKRTVELHVKDPAILKNVKVGDQVEGAYVEAVAIAVTPAK